MARTPSRKLLIALAACSLQLACGSNGGDNASPVPDAGSNPYDAGQVLPDQGAGRPDIGDMGGTGMQDMENADTSAGMDTGPFDQGTDLGLDLGSEDQGVDIGGPACEVTCDLLDFVNDPSTASSGYVASTKTLSIVLAGSLVTSRTFLDASLSSGPMSGADFVKKGTIEGNRLVFDLSDIPSDPSAIRLNNLEVFLECGAARALILGGQIDLSQDLTSENLSCSVPPF